MRILLLLCFLLTTVTATAQVVVVNDDFEDQDLTSNPAWTGDLSIFTFVPDNGNTLLRLNDTGGGTAQLRTLSSAAFGSWEFFIDQDFAPSNNNRGFIFLMSDRENLSGAVNGYAIRTGENLSPNFFRLFRFDNGVETEIATGTLDISSGGPFQVRVERTLDGEWTLLESAGFGSTPQPAATVTDNTHTESEWFGFLLNYTSTRAQNFFFDNIVVINIEPFRLQSADVSAARSIDVTFNFPVDEATLQPGNFFIEQLGSPDSATLAENAFTVRLTYGSAIPDGTYTLVVNNVESEQGESIEPDSELTFLFENPFSLVDATAVSATVIELFFSEAVDEASLTPSGFLINESIVPDGATRPEPTTVRLTFSDPLPSGRLTVDVSGIESESGFELPEGSRAEAVLFDEPQPGDILLNEFMYRPDSGFVRYTELVNTSDRFINLQDWQLFRRADAPSPGGVFATVETALGPGEWIAITPDTAALRSIYGEVRSVQMSGYPGFTTTVADEIRLFSPDGELADSLRYDPSVWGGNGVALERRDTDVDARFVENWGESPNPLRGTPGQANEVAPDTTPPVWQQLTFTSATEFLLLFDERLAETAGDAARYSISPFVPISTVQLSNNEVRLQLGEELENNQVYEISISGISDLFGNVAPDESRSVEFLEFEMPLAGDVVINEILYRRLQSGSPEFVELFNTTENNIDLSGWTLSDASGSATIPQGTALRGNDFIVFTDTEAFASGNDRIIRLPGFQSLSNNGDAVVIRNDEGTTIDSLFYLPEWGGNVPGLSLERRDPQAISIDRANWGSSQAENGSTPLLQNTLFEPDTTPPGILFANLFHPDSVAVVFTEFIDPSTGPQFTINNSPAAILQLDPGAANRVVLDAGPFQPGIENVVETATVSDFQGNSSDRLSQPVAQPVQPGDLVFNEIMFDPIRDNRDGLPNQSEYLEVINRRGYAISMEGIFIHDEPDEDGAITRITPVSSRRQWIPANGLFLLHAAPDAERFSESLTARFFNLGEELAPFAFRFNRTTLSLPLAGRQVFLADSTDTVIDMVDYRPEWHNPNIIDTRGISLERVNPDGDSNNPQNWGSHPTPIGGSPLMQNNLFQQPGGVSAGQSITLEPNPFAPHDGGMTANLFINYSFDDPNYLLTVRIYDRYGRLVRRLTEGEPAGFEGALIWDGQTDDSLIARIGIYVVFVEAVNSSTGQTRRFRETAVLARQF
ncbi:MAG: lamin tail domain-containing protein [Balneolaceae bacterium]